jgi:ribosomal protein L5
MPSIEKVTVSVSVPEPLMNGAMLKLIVKDLV